MSSREQDEVGENQWWEQFDHEPDYPQTHESVDFQELDWWKEYSGV